MSDESNNRGLGTDPSHTRTGSSSARKALAVAGASFMMMVALIGGGLAFAFWSFSNQPVAPVVVESPEAMSPAGKITAPVSDETTTVPDLVSRTLASANDVLYASGLDLGAVTRVYVDGFVPGLVVAQSPAAGTGMAKGGVVSVTVSKGTLSAALPTVVGLTVPEAKEALAAVGLSVSRVQSVYNERTKSGVVMSLAADGARQPQRGDTVSLVVSKGQAPVNMPSLIGLSPSQAQSACSAAGVVLSLTPSGSEQGVVYRQSPSPGSGIIPGSTALARVDTAPSASLSLRLTKLDDTWEKYNKQLGAHVTCASTSTDDGAIKSMKWQVKGLDVNASGTGNSISFILPGYRRYGSTSVALTVTDVSGQSATVRKNITVDWDKGTLQY